MGMTRLAARNITKVVWVKFCKKAFGDLQGVFLTKGVVVSVFVRGCFSGAIQQTGARTYP